MRLDRRDYEAVLSFLEEAHAVEEPAPFTPHLLDRPPQERRLTPPLSLVFDRPRRDATGATIRTHLSLEVPVRYPCLPERPNGWRAHHKGLAPAHLLGRHCRTLAQAEVLGLHPVHPSGSPHRSSTGVAPPLG